MKLVPKTKHGELKWQEVIEVKSPEDFVNDRNEGLQKLFGKPVQGYWLMNNNVVEHTDTSGKLIETYHPCETNPFRLV